MRDITNAVNRAITEAILRIPESGELPYSVILGELRRIDGRLDNLEKYLGDVMTAVSDYVKANQEYQDKMDTAIGGLALDIKQLKDDLEKLNNNPGTLSKEDQALLDGALVRTRTMSENLQGLDSQTNPPPPPPPPPDTPPV